MQLKPGIIGAGSFGTAIARLMSTKTDVMVYTRKQEMADKINREHQHMGYDIPENVVYTADPAFLSSSCQVLFPIVPSDNFRAMMKTFAPFLTPSHLMIHGTKGFDVAGMTESDWKNNKLTRANISTMSEIIQQESLVIRVGCLSGPNLSKEILDGQPTATLVASKFREVIKVSQKFLNSDKFHVFGSYDMLGAELAGALKNAIALGSGLLAGFGLGKNIQAMLITRGLVEMIALGQAMGAESRAFLGTAGIGDLIATATSEQSRNFTFGMAFAKIGSIEKVKETMPELAEGVRTIHIIKHLVGYYNLRSPIMEALYAVVYDNYPLEKTLKYLMQYPYDVDVDFI